MFKKVSGTKDILPEEAVIWQEIENRSRQVFSLYNYREIRLPLIEDAALFNRSLGESTEVVQKQMFLIPRQNETYALRPEGTASVARAYIENYLDKSEGFLKLYYTGPMFRAERPQKGRQRQFHHIGCEAIGSAEAALDVEVISLANALLNAFGVKDYRILLNSLGCAQDKQKLQNLLSQQLTPNLDKLCPDCQRRFEQNILRVLDCKNEPCRRIIEKLDFHQGLLCAGCERHFSFVKQGLESLGIEYVFVPYLIRGLDYYTRTVFEFTHPALGAQDALGAGGRYDNLLKQLGGPDAPAVGFALGVERVKLAAGTVLSRPPRPLVYLVLLGEKAQSAGLKLLASLRQNGITADTDYQDKSIKGAMRAAGDLNASYVLVLGENELAEGCVALKDMSTGAQEKVALEKITEILKQKLISNTFNDK